MNVGLCWQGSRTHRNDGVRSIPYDQLAPLEAVTGVTWHCLAKEEWRPEMAVHGWVNALAGCVDWYDTANAVKRLDLVISVDTALVHLTGGLLDGPPVWMLVAAMPDMRWGLRSKTTPWYDRVLLYRQERVGDWRPVLAEVATDLQWLVNQRTRRAA